MTFILAIILLVVAAVLFAMFRKYNSGEEHGFGNPSALPMWDRLGLDVEQVSV